MNRGAALLLLLACQTASPTRVEPLASRTEPVHRPRVYHSTTALQAALDRAPSGSILRLAPGTYRVGNLVLADKTDFELNGDGAVLLMDGAAESGARIGIELRGHLRNVRIVGLTIRGDGRLESRHAGIWSRSGQNLERVRIESNHVKDVTLGISLNADLGGRIEDVQVIGNDIDNVVGSESGYGYGIHIASGRTAPMRAIVSHNRIKGAQRHSIYQARGWGAIIRDNEISEHRSKSGTGAMRPAVMVARGGDVRVTNNRISRSTDGAVMVTAAGHYSARIVIEDNVITDSLDAMPSIIIGSQDSALEGFPERVVVSGNRIEQGDARQGESIRVYGVAGLRIVGNVFVSGPGFRGGSHVDLRCECEVTLEGNTPPQRASPVSIWDRAWRDHQQPRTEHRWHRSTL